MSVKYTVEEMKHASKCTTWRNKLSLLYYKLEYTTWRKKLSLSTLSQLDIFNILSLISFGGAIYTLALQLAKQFLSQPSKFSLFLS